MDPCGRIIAPQIERVFLPGLATSGCVSILFANRRGRPCSGDCVRHPNRPLKHTTVWDQADWRAAPPFAVGATVAFRLRPQSGAYRLFIGPNANGRSGSIWVRPLIQLSRSATAQQGPLNAHRNRSILAAHLHAPVRAWDGRCSGSSEPWARGSLNVRCSKA